MGGGTREPAGFAMSVGGASYACSRSWSARESSRGGHPPVNREPRAARLRAAKKEKPVGSLEPTGFKNTPGSDLLSHALTHAVPSAVEGLTSVFGMGTGVTPLL